MLRRDTGVEQPLTVQTRQIYMVFGPSTLQIRPRLRPQGRGPHGLRYVAVGLKAAFPNAGPHGSQDAFRSGAQQADHLPDGLLHDSSGTAPPSGVDRSHAPGVRVMEQKDAAVGGEHHQGQSFFSGDEGVGVVVPVPDQTLPGVGGGAEPHIIPMDLPGEDGVRRVHIQGGEKAAVVLLHVLRRVPASGAQVQGIPRRRRHPAPPGGESVAHPAQQGRGEPDQTLLFMGDK